MSKLRTRLAVALLAVLAITAPQIIGAPVAIGTPTTRADLELNAAMWQTETTDFSYAAPGDPITVKVAVSNYGPDAAENVQLRIQTAPELRNIRSIVDKSGQFSCQFTSAADQMGEVRCTAATFAASNPKFYGANRADIYFEGTVAPTARGPLALSAEVGANTPDPSADNNAASATIDVVARKTDAAITLAPIGSFQAGTDSKWKITVRNNGPVATDFVDFQTHIYAGDPDRVDIAAANNVTCSHLAIEANQVSATCRTGALAVGATASVELVYFEADVSDSGTVSGRAYIDPQFPDSNQHNNEVKVTGVAVRAADPRPVSPVKPGYVARVAGASRYETGIAFSKTYFPAGADTVFVASGQAYPDALAASALAGSNAGPVLLTMQRTLPANVATELKRLRPKQVVLAGGPAAISDTVLAATKTALPGVDVQRIGGKDRFATAAQLATETYPAGSEVVYIANGLDFPDALTAAAAAGSKDGPVLLTETNSLPPTTQQALAKLQPKRVVLVGGEAVISTQVENTIDATSPDAAVERAGGKNRFITANLIATKEFAPGAQRIVVANAFDYPDALVGAAVAAKFDSPVLLTIPYELEQTTQTALGALKPAAVSVAGGSAVVSEKVRFQIATVTGLSAK